MNLYMSVSLADGGCGFIADYAGEGSRGEPFFRMILIFQPTVSHSTIAKRDKLLSKTGIYI